MRVRPSNTRTEYVHTQQLRVTPVMLHLISLAELLLPWRAAAMMRWDAGHTKFTKLLGVYYAYQGAVGALQLILQ